MAAHPCAAVLKNGVTCGAHRANPIHSRVNASKDAHPFLDARGAAKLANESTGRAAYVRSEAHQRAYEHVEGECIFFAGGAPTDCWGAITPGHVVPRSVTGDLAISDRYPVAPQCMGHNRDVDANVELRKWAQTHQFQWHDGRFYFYRYDDVMYRTLLLEVNA